MARTFVSSRSVAFISRLRATMGNEAWEAQDLAVAMYAHRQNVLEYLNHLMGTKPRQAYIAGYRKPEGGGRYAYLYRLGDMPDARHPRTPAEAKP